MIITVRIVTAINSSFDNLVGRQLPNAKGNFAL